jgi:hypothetical protein
MRELKESFPIAVIMLCIQGNSRAIIVVARIVTLGSVKNVRGGLIIKDENFLFPITIWFFLLGNAQLLDTAFRVASKSFLSSNKSKVY